MPTTPQAQQLATTAVLVAGGLAVVTHVAAGDVPPVRIGLGVVIAGTGLAALAQVAPGVAGPLAVLALTSAVIVYGGPAMRVLTRATSPASSSSSSTSPGRPLQPIPA